MTLPPAIAFPDDLLTLARSLDAESLSRVIVLRDWLVTTGARMEDSNEVLTGFLTRLIDLGLPIDRAVSAIEALHSEYAGIGRFWTREEGTVVRYLPHGDRREDIYQTSPFAHVNRTGEWLVLDLANTPDDLFPIIPELKEAGYRHPLHQRGRERDLVRDPDTRRVRPARADDPAHAHAVLRPCHRAARHEQPARRGTAHLCGRRPPQGDSLRRDPARAGDAHPLGHHLRRHARLHAYLLDLES
jgi:hypothetical protein